MSEMKDYIREAEDDDLSQDTAAKLMVALCVDTSFSMIQEGRIEAVNHGISNFLKSAYEDVYVKDSLEVCIVTFGGERAKLIRPFKKIKTPEFKPLFPSGGTHLADGVRLAIRQIEKRRNDYEDVGVICYRPWLIIMSDGRSDDNVTEAAQLVHSMVAAKRLKLKCIGIGSGSDESDLRKFTGEKIEKCGNIEIIDFFNILSRSAAGLSIMAPEEDSQVNIY